MRKFLFFGVSYFLFFLGALTAVESSSMITIPHVGGRLGNLLSTYLQARWSAHKYHLTFFYSSMPELEPFKLSSSPQESKLIDLSQYNFVLLKNAETIGNFKNNIIYIQKFSPLPPSRIKEMKKDPVFLKAIRDEISLKEPLTLIYPPENTISIAVHLRKGGGFDKPLKSVQIFNLSNEEDRHPKAGTKFVDKQFPLKCPPEQFYIDQIRKLAQEFVGKNVYVFIFTDDQNPKAITARVEKEVGLDNFSFNCRTENTGPDKNVLEDLFSMPNFDYLIFPDSTFSSVAALLGDFKAIIYPTRYHWEQDEEDREYLVIDKVICFEN